ncbi:MAG: hypothetical protein ACOYB1_18305 [Limnohabitans sp.]
MTIDRSFIEKIQELSPANIHHVDDLPYADKKITLITPPTINTLIVNTLTAIETYCQGELSDDQGRYLIHVAAPDRVDILGQDHVVFRYREMPVSAELQATPFPFGKFMSTELFIVALQSQFIQDDTTAAMLALVGNLTTTKESRTLDDGVSQTVEARVGISKVGAVIVPNPVQLRPYRTFLEVEQPLSNFVFRINAADHSCALFEADGGFWKNCATASIKERLDRELAEFIDKGIFTVLA